jgi:probable rRNA maturation factor
MEVLIDLQDTIESTNCPKLEKFETWVEAALAMLETNFVKPELTIRIVSADESQQLNAEYRAKDKPTNILSFPFEVPEMLPADVVGEFLGDLVICEPVMVEEAKQQQKLLESHWAHLVVHGVLHLLGYDHIGQNEADTMESIEIETLEKLGFDNPY